MTAQTILDRKLIAETDTERVWFVTGLDGDGDTWTAEETELKNPEPPSEPFNPLAFIAALINAPGVDADLRTALIASLPADVRAELAYEQANPDTGRTWWKPWTWRST